MKRAIRSYSRAIYWRTGAVVLTILTLAHLSYVHHDSSAAASEYISTLGLAESWNAWSPSVDAWRSGADMLGGGKEQFVMDGEPDWCTEAEYLDGAWVTREEEVTMENIRRIYKYTASGQLKCQARDDRGNPSPDDPAFYARILETAQYEWKPNSGCRTHEFDKWNFAKYCLRSRGGCSIVGDSLADQIYSVVQSILIDPKDDLFVLHPSVERIYNITINKNHPSALRLANDAGVELDRLDRPFFNYWREHHLVHREELDAALADSPGYEPWTGGPSLFENGWIWDRSWWYERWNWLLDQAVQLGPRASDGKVPKEESSVISFSTGPHWTTVELWPKEWHRTDTTEDLYKGYRGTVDTVIRNVTAIAKEHKVLSWWRSAVSPHPECQQYDGPENNRTTLHSTQNPKAKAFNWDQFAVFDKYAAEKLDYEPSTSLPRTSDSTAMRFMNLWPLSVTRPDAHLKPTTDCMHHCSPGGPNEWLGFMWHMMVLQAENDDYDEPRIDEFLVDGY